MYYARHRFKCYIFTMIILLSSNHIDHLDNILTAVPKKKKLKMFNKKKKN